MKTHIDTDRIKQAVDLRIIAERYTMLRKQSSTESAGPCPWCGGTDRFRVFADHFFCRAVPGHCGRKGDTIEFIVQRENVDFKSACEMLANGVLPTSATPVQPAQQTIKSPAKEWNEAYWLDCALKYNQALRESTGRIAKQARDYLTSRGLTIETIEAFKLGYGGINLPGQEGKESSISLPWFNRQSDLVAIKFRFLDIHTYTDSNGKEKIHRYTSRGSVKGNLFGWQTVKGPSRNRTVIICEGEFNDMSLWQASNGEIDILSSGAENGLKDLPEDVVAFVQQYAYRIIWADEREVADNAARLIKADLSMASPGGQDANDLLQAGKLAKLLTAMIKKIGADIPVAPEPHPVSREEWQQLMEGYGRPRPVPTRPPLPPELWKTGMNKNESWRLFNELSETYRVAWDSNEDGYYVMAPTYG